MIQPINFVSCCHVSVSSFRRCSVTHVSEATDVNSSQSKKQARVSCLIADYFVYSWARHQDNLRQDYIPDYTFWLRVLNLYIATSSHTKANSNLLYEMPCTCKIMKTSPFLDTCVNKVQLNREELFHPCYSLSQKLIFLARHAVIMKSVLSSWRCYSK